MDEIHAGDPLDQARGGLQDPEQVIRACPAVVVLEPDGSSQAQAQKQKVFNPQDLFVFHEFTVHISRFTAKGLWFLVSGFWFITAKYIAL